VSGTHIGCGDTRPPELGRVPSSFSTLGGVETWVQHLYTVPHGVADKRQTHGNMDSVRCWVVLEHWRGGRRCLARTSGVVTPKLGRVPPSVSTLGGVETWVQQLYTVPQSVADKRQVHGNMDSVRCWVVLEHWRGGRRCLARTSGVWHAHRVW